MPDSSISVFDTAAAAQAVDTQTTASGDHRQVIVAGDPTVVNSVAVVRGADPASNDEGLVVRDPNTTAIVSGLRDLRIQSIVDGTIGIENITRLRNVVDGTLSTVVRLSNLIDGTLSTVQRVQNLVDGTLTTVAGVDRVRNIVDGTLTTVVGITNTVKINAADGTFAVYFSPSEPTVKVKTGSTIAVSLDPGYTLGNIEYVTRVRNLVDGTLTAVTGVDRIRSIVDGTLSLVTTVTGLDRVRNIVDGTITTVTGITNTIKIQAADGTLAVYLNPALTMGSVSHIDDTVKIAAADGTLAIYQAPGTAPFRVHGLGSTANIFTVSGSVTGSYPSGKTIVAPSANASFKVFAIALTTTAQIHSVVTLQNGGGSPTEFWRYALQAPTQGVAGANVTVTPPGFLFATGASTTLGIAVDSASLVHYSIGYIKESA